MAHWLLKAAVIPVSVSVFFFAYFQLLNHPVFAVAIMPLTVLDRLIAFQPWALVPYFTLWVYVFLVPALLHGRRELISYSVGAAGTAGVGLGIFFFWPTAVPRPTIDWAHYPAVQFLKEIDAAGNACPSLHVAFAVFTAIGLERLLQHIGAPKGWRAINALWCGAILYSTLATKQHVALDLAAGVVLGALGGFCFRPETDDAANGAGASEPPRETQGRTERV
ncbi:MAG: phosphatase PAP2 family protein [Opitutaceae bacterium]